MALWSNRRNCNKTKWAWLVGTLMLLAPVGCGGSANPGTGTPGAASPTAQGQPAESTAVVATPIHPVSQDPNLENTFLKATLCNPPGEEQRPPDVTRAGQSVGKFYQAIVGQKGVGGLWEQVKFVSPAGKKMHYTATIKTSAGTMIMELWPDVAPNHVRNFVALAQAGYYNGLSFDRAMQQKGAISPGDLVQYVEAGCPLGTGEAGYGSIGYWLKSELSDKVRHEPGTVGAWHEEGEVESAGCKFYITLNEAESLNMQYTIFGKVTQGLEVVRKIYDSPKALDSVDGRLEQSVMIEQVLIHVNER